MKFQINEEILWDYNDGLLPTAEQKAVEDILAQSVEWQAVFNKIKAQKALLNTTTPVVVNSDFSKNILAAWSVEQAHSTQKKVQKDYLLKSIYTALAGLLGLSILVFFYALLKEARIGHVISNTYTNWAYSPSYLFSMLFLTLGAAAFALDRVFEARDEWGFVSR